MPPRCRLGRRRRSPRAALAQPTAPKGGSESRGVLRRIAVGTLGDVHAREHRLHRVLFEECPRPPSLLARLATSRTASSPRWPARSTLPAWAARTPTCGPASSSSPSSRSSTASSPLSNPTTPTTWSTRSSASSPPSNPTTPTTWSTRSSASSTPTCGPDRRPLGGEGSLVHVRSLAVPVEYHHQLGGAADGAEGVRGHGGELGRLPCLDVDLAVAEPQADPPLDDDE